MQPDDSNAMICRWKSHSSISEGLSASGSNTECSTQHKVWRTHRITEYQNRDSIERRSMMMDLIFKLDMKALWFGKSRDIDNRPVVCDRNYPDHMNIEHKPLPMMVEDHTSPVVESAKFITQNSENVTIDVSGSAAQKVNKTDSRQTSFSDDLISWLMHTRLAHFVWRIGNHTS